MDEVKIDRSFIQEFAAQGDDDVIVRSTINLGHALNLKVVAEGVEAASSWEALGRLGCDLIQGYFVSKPLPTEQFTAWMTAWSSDHQPGIGHGELAAGGERQHSRVPAGR